MSCSAAHRNVHLTALLKIIQQTFHPAVTLRLFLERKMYVRFRYFENTVHYLPELLL